MSTEKKIFMVWDPAQGINVASKNGTLYYPTLHGARIASTRMKLQGVEIHEYALVKAESHKQSKKETTK
jgi:hypothetical protein